MTTKYHFHFSDCVVQVRSTRVLASAKVYVYRVEQSIDCIHEVVVVLALQAMKYLKTLLIKRRELQARDYARIWSLLKISVILLWFLISLNSLSVVVLLT